MQKWKFINVYEVLCKADDMTSFELNHLTRATERSPMPGANDSERSHTIYPLLYSTATPSG